MKGVAPNGSMLASNILLIIELPAIEAARPARSPTDKPNNECFSILRTQQNSFPDPSRVNVLSVITWTYVIWSYQDRWCVCWVQAGSPCLWWRVWWKTSHRTACCDWYVFPVVSMVTWPLQTHKENKTWDHMYNRLIHYSTSKSTVNICFQI